MAFPVRTAGRGLQGFAQPGFGEIGVVWHQEKIGLSHLSSGHYGRDKSDDNIEFLRVGRYDDRWTQFLGSQVSKRERDKHNVASLKRNPGHINRAFPRPQQYKGLRQSG